MGDKMFKSGTPRSLFVVEALLGGKDQQGAGQDRVMFIVGLYNAEREAQVAVRHYFDLARMPSSVPLWRRVP
jgi:hypothetical protein